MFKTCSWLGQYLFRIWLVHNLFMTCSWLVHYLLITCSWPVHDMFVSCSWLVYDLFMTTLQLLRFLTSFKLDLFMSCLHHIYNLFLTCSWLVLDIFTTFSQFDNDLFTTCLLFVNAFVLQFFSTLLIHLSFFACTSLLELLSSLTLELIISSLLNHKQPQLRFSNMVLIL